MAVTSREELIDYCLRKLGAPVLDINVDPDQVEDRIDEALQMYQAYHSDAMHHSMLAVQANADDVANKYITLPESMAYVRGVIEQPSSGGSSASQLSDFWQYSAQQYEALRGSIAAGGGQAMSNYYISMTSLSQMSFLFTGKNRMRFSRHQDRIYFEDDIVEGAYYLVDGYAIIDQAAYADVWDDMWLKHYATACIKMQWGINLTKFIGMTLPGGVQFNGEMIFNEAKDDMQRLEEELRTNWEFPPDFFVG